MEAYFLQRDDGIDVMHTHDSDVEYMAVEVMEREFLKSPNGQQYAKEYMTLHNQYEALKEKKMEFHKRIKMHFIQFMEAHT